MYVHSGFLDRDVAVVFYNVIFNGKVDYLYLFLFSFSVFGHLRVDEWSCLCPWLTTI